jgi:hypothetical protein
MDLVDDCMNWLIQGKGKDLSVNCRVVKMYKVYAKVILLYQFKPPRPDVVENSFVAVLESLRLAGTRNKFRLNTLLVNYIISNPSASK